MKQTFEKPCKLILLVSKAVTKFIFFIYLLQDLLEPLTVLSSWLQRDDAIISDVQRVTKVTLARLEIMKTE
jgi:hypothetical protein